MEFTRGNQERMYPGSIGTGYNLPWLQNPASTGTRVPGTASFNAGRGMDPSKVPQYTTPNIFQPNVAMDWGDPAIMSEDAGLSGLLGGPPGIY